MKIRWEQLRFGVVKVREEQRLEKTHNDQRRT